METIYRHTQVGAVTLAGMGIALVAAVFWGVRASQPALLTAALLVGVVLVLFSTLTVVVRDGALVVFFGPGLIRRRIPLRRIRDVRVVRTPWTYGWGIRLTPRGWLWNVSGLDGVELQFDDGRRFRIGSDEPTRLAEALRREVQPPAKES
jgi:hypothetical protein